MTDDRLIKKDSPLDWLRRELSDPDLTLTDSSDLVRYLDPKMPKGHISYFARPGLLKAVREELRAKGIVPNHAKADPDTGRVPLARIDQLELPEIVAFLRKRKQQADQDYVAARAIAETWLAAQTDATVTADELMTQAGWSVAA